MAECEVYMHGQILGTHSFLLKGDFLKTDEYSEIKEKYFLPCGETGTAATVLASFGVNVKIDDDLVRFASTCSTIAISRFPLPLKPPTIGEVEKILMSAN